jgi:hypothetical protein
VARVLAIVPDLMLSSRVAESLRSAGHDVTVMPSLPNPVGADVLICDLDAVDVEEVAQADAPTLGFYSHVDIETKQAADAAGVDLTVPRSRMARELPQLVERLLA